MTEMPEDDRGHTTFVGPVTAAARMAELISQPGMAERVVAIRDAMAEADRGATEEQEHPSGNAG